MQVIAIILNVFLVITHPANNKHLSSRVNSHPAFEKTFEIRTKTSISMAQCTGSSIGYNWRSKIVTKQKPTKDIERVWNASTQISSDYPRGIKLNSSRIWSVYSGWKL